MGECEITGSAFNDEMKVCHWKINEFDNDYSVCVWQEPEFSLITLGAIVLVVILVTAPFYVLLDYIVNNILRAPTVHEVNTQLEALPALKRFLVGMSQAMNTIRS